VALVEPPIEGVREAFPEMVQIDRIAAGGQKVVYRAVTAAGSMWALKLISDPGGGSDQRALREVQAAARLRGPTFATIHRIDTCDVEGVRYVFMLEEFIQGESLRSRLQPPSPQPTAFVRQLGEALLDALGVVEAARLVHRDIKPENIMLAQDGRIVLIDFGIARHLDSSSLTSSYAMFGPMSLGYCAPEQVTNQKRAISIRTEFFALGVVLYEVTAGHNPFVIGCTRQAEVLQRCLSHVPPPLSGPGVPDGLSRFVLMCLEKSAHRRPSTVVRARALFDAIQWS
jgi:serine/threonine-protein kinase